MAQATAPFLDSTQFDNLTDSIEEPADLGANSVFEVARPTRFERVTFALGGQGSSKVVRPVRNVSRSIGALIPWPRRCQFSNLSCSTGMWSLAQKTGMRASARSSF